MRNLLKRIAMTVAVAGLAVCAAPATGSARTPSEGAGSDRAQSYQRAGDARSKMRTEREAGHEAASSGSYRMAVEHFLRLRDLLDEEMRFLQDQWDRDPAGPLAAEYHSALASNREEAAEVTRTLSLLRVAQGPAR